MHLSRVILSMAMRIVFSAVAVTISKSLANYAITIALGTAQAPAPLRNAAIVASHQMVPGVQVDAAHLLQRGADLHLPGE